MEFVRNLIGGVGALTIGAATGVGLYHFGVPYWIASKTTWSVAFLVAVWVL